MYIRARGIAGGVSMTCKDCGHEISMNKICERPIQAATDMLKHMAAHNAARAFAVVESVIRPEPEAIVAGEPVPHAPCGAVDRFEPPITRSYIIASVQARQRFLPKIQMEKEIFKRFRILPEHHASNRYQVSLVHPQLKGGPANQRHPFSPATILSEPKFDRNRNNNQWNKEQ